MDNLYDKKNKQERIIIAIALFLAVLLSCLSSLNNSIIVLLISSILCLVLLYKWDWSIYVLIGASLFNGILFNFSGWTLRPDNIITIVSIISTTIVIIVRKNIKINFSYFGLISVFFIYQVIVSYSVSPILSSSIDGLIQLFLAILPFFIITQILSISKDNVIKFVVFYILIGVLEAIYGIINFSLYSVTKVDLGGLMFAQWGQSVSVKGTFFEANLFGSYISTCLLLIVSLLISKTYTSKYKLWIILSIPILSTALLLSWTRSAWIGFILGLTVLSINYGRKFINSRNILIFIVITIFVIVPTIYLISGLFDSLSGTKGLFSYKLFNLFQSDSGTGAFRLNQFGFAYNDFLQHNIFIGNGYFSLKVFGTGAWITNTFLFVLHDSGIIGALLFLYIMLKIVINGFRSMYYSINSKKINCYLAGAVAGIVNLIFTTNFTASHTLSQFWIQLGIMIVLSEYADIFLKNHKEIRRKKIKIVWSK